MKEEVKNTANLHISESNPYILFCVKQQSPKHNNIFSLMVF